MCGLENLCIDYNDATYSQLLAIQGVVTARHDMTEHGMHVYQHIYSALSMGDGD